MGDVEWRKKHRPPIKDDHIQRSLRPEASGTVKPRLAPPEMDRFTRKAADLDANPPHRKRPRSSGPLGNRVVLLYRRPLCIVGLDMGILGRALGRVLGRETGFPLGGLFPGGLTMGFSGLAGGRVPGGRFPGGLLPGGRAIGCSGLPGGRW